MEMSDPSIHLWSCGGTGIHQGGYIITRYCGFKSLRDHSVGLFESKVLFKKVNNSRWSGGGIGRPSLG